MVFFLGCDVSKTKLDVALVDEHGTVQWQDVVPNEPDASALFLLTLQGAYPCISDSAAADRSDAYSCELACVVESTSTMHQLFAETCYDCGIPCYVYNPILTKQQIKGSIRAKKTDKTDAVLIARIGLRGDGRLYVPDSCGYARYGTRACTTLAKLSSATTLLTAHITRVLDTELNQAARDILQGIQEQLAAARAQFIADTAEHAPAGLMALLQTIPGVGPFVAASLIGEIQDMERFSGTCGLKALTAYAGLDPRIRQSGKSLNSTGRLTKRGSSHLRRSAFISANVARQHNPVLKAYYEKKRSEGKSYKVATCAVARKQLAIIRAVWLSGKPFVHHGQQDEEKS
jgi:transposase